MNFLLHRCKYEVVSVGSKLLSISGGATPIGANYPEHGIPFLRVQNIMPGYINTSNLVYIEPATHELELHRSKLQTGDVLLTITGVSYGKSAYVPNGFGEANINQHSVRMKLSHELLPEYVATFLNSRMGKLQTDMKVTGVTRPALDYEEIKTLKIPLLPVPMQQEIQKFAKEAELKRKESLELYQETEAMLLEALGLDSLDLSPQLSYTANLDEVFSAERFDAQFFQTHYRRIIDHLEGTFTTEQIEAWGPVLKGRSVTYTEDGEGIPIIRSGDLTDLHHAEDLKRAYPSEPIFYLRKGDVCISSIGFGSIGKVEVFDREGRHGTVSEVTVIRQHRVNPYYLQTFLRSAAGQFQIERWITGATGQLHLYPRDVGKIFVPVVEDKLQDEIEHKIMQARLKKNEAKGLLESAKRRVEALILEEG